MQRTRLAFAIALLAAGQAHAALFDDEEARRRVADLRTTMEARLDTQSKALVDLSNQLQALREENAKLRGQIETLNYEQEQGKKRAQDFYLDLDTRIRKLEPAANAGTAAAPAAAAAQEPAKPAVPPDVQEYDAALALLKANKFKDAAKALGAFLNNYPDSSLAPSAQYWQGNAYYALGDCKQALDAQIIVATRWQDSNKAPDAMLAIATCQQDMGNRAAAQRTLETLIGKYPDSAAATQARQRIKKK